MTRARAVALRRRRPDPVHVLHWLLLAAMLLAAGAGFAQTPGAVPPAPSAPTLPPGSGGDSAALMPPAVVRPDVPGGTTSNGLATPRPNQDPGIVAPTPSAPSGMPVIRPPGTAGGNPAVLPK